MTRQEALESLDSPRTLQRLRGARFLTRGALPEDRGSIKAALDREHDVLVIEVLGRALMALGGQHVPDAGSLVLDSADEDLSDIYAQAIEDVSATFLHELRPLVGGVDSRASREIRQYEKSRTFASVRRIRSFMHAMQRLRDAAQVPLMKQIDLSDFVRDECDREEVKPCEVVFARDDPVLAWVDPDLLKIAFANVLRNACESVIETKSDAGKVLVSWGLTDRDVWVAVIDEGIGLPEAPERLTDPGFTFKSKSTHDGFGLTVAKRAMTSLGGSVALTPRREGGATCELRWPRGETP